MKKSKKSESLEAVHTHTHTHTPVYYKKEKQKSKQRVIEFNLSKSVVIITTIVVISVALTTAKVVKTLVQAEDNKKLEDTEQQDNERVVYVNSTTKEGTDTTDETKTTVTQQDINIFNMQKSRNQYVWVPVDEPSRIYGVDSTGKIWGKLYDFSSSGRKALNLTESNGIMCITDRKGSYKEPDIVWKTGKYAYDTDLYLLNYGYELKETRYDMLAQELEQNYYEIIESIKKYGGFYIGRYETGGIDGTVGVKRMDIDIKIFDWHKMYKKCLKLKGNNDNIKTIMII